MSRRFLPMLGLAAMLMTPVGLEAATVEQILDVSMADLPAAEARALRSRIAQLEAELRRQARRLGLSEGALMRIARHARVHYSGANIDQLVAQITQKLDEAASLRSEIRALRAQLASLTDPAVRDPGMAILARANEAISAGRFEEADRLLISLQELRQADVILGGELMRKAVSARAELASLQFDFPRARRIYEDYRAAERRRLSSTEWWTRMGAAGAYQQEGRLGLDSNGLTEAIREYREALQFAPRAEQPDNWARTQNNLGNTLRFLGEQDGNQSPLEQALEAYADVVQIWTRTGAPLDWAKTEANRGGALVSLGQLGRRPAQVRLGIEAYRNALPIITARATPLERASLQDSLGTALTILARSAGREEAQQLLRDALAAFEAALAGRPEGSQPLLWAATQNNRGNTLSLLANLEQGDERFRQLIDQAIDAFNRSLAARPRAFNQLGWAQTQSNLGITLMALGVREQSPTRLADAVAAHRLALGVYVRPTYSYRWALAAEDMARALYGLAGYGNSCDAATEAAELLPEIIRIYGADPLRANNRAGAERLLNAIRGLQPRVCVASR